MLAGRARGADFLGVEAQQLLAARDEAGLERRRAFLERHEARRDAGGMFQQFVELDARLDALPPLALEVGAHPELDGQVALRLEITEQG